MALRDDIQAVFDNADLRPAAKKTQISHLLQQACEKNGELDILVHDNALEACTLYADAALTLLRGGYPKLSELLLLEAWDNFSLRQRQERVWIYKAGIAVYLSVYYLRHGDKGAAVRWALVTHADDSLKDHQGDARDMLLDTWGIAQPVIAAFEATAHQNAARVEQEHQGDWSMCYGFPEDVLLRFVKDHPAHAAVLTHETAVAEFPVNEGYFRALLDRVEQADAKDNKGDALEDIAAYLFLLLPGCVPRPNLVKDDSGFETDLVVSNLNPTDQLRTDILGRSFIIEYKNWNKTVGIEQVGYFLHRMRLTHSPFGVLFAAKGITGRSKRSKEAAHGLIAQTFQADNSVCVVIDRDDLERLACGEFSCWSLLLEKIEAVRFGK